MQKIIPEKLRCRLAKADRLVAGGLALIFTYALFIEYLPPFKRVHLWSDVGGYHYPLQAYAVKVLKEGRLPLWDSSIYSGISFVGNVQAALLYPPTWLMYAAAAPLPRLPFKALEVFTFLHVWMAFWLSYLWLRDRMEKIAAALGAAVFAFSGYMMYETLHTGVIGALTWIPLALWGVDQSVGRRDWRPLWKVAVGSALSLLGGYPAAWIAVCAVILVYAIGSREHWRAFIGVCIAIGASGVLAAVQLLPVMDAHSLMVLEAKYGPGAWGWRTLLLSLFVPNWFDFNPGHPPTFDPGCVYLYLGVPAIFAGLWAVWRHRLRPYIQPILGLGATLFLANPPEFFLRTIERIPPLENTMSPFQFYAGVAPMAALITAFSLNDFLKSKARLKDRLPRWVAPGVAAALAVWSFRQLAIWARGGRFATNREAIVWTAIAFGIFSLGLWAFRASSGRQRILLGIMILFAAGTDYKVFGSGRWFNAQDGDHDDFFAAKGINGLSDRAFQAITSNRDYRIACDEGGSPHSTDLRHWGLATPQGFDPFLPAHYRNAVERWVKFKTNRLFFMDVKNGAMLQAFGVRYVITHEGAASEAFLAKSPDFALIGGTDSYFRLYEYLHAKAPYRWEDGANGSAQVVSWKPERRELLVQSDRGGRFALIEQFFPGWNATVDGQVVKTERWNETFQAIEVPSGQHRVVFEFSPRSLPMGAAISLVALGGLLLVVRADARRSRGITAETLAGNPGRNPGRNAAADQ